jgi:CRP-like cAMP-binding protein
MYYSKELRNSEAKIKNLAQMNVREKVADGLIYVNTIFNEHNENNQINISRKDLADLIGINTEQLSRNLSEFKKENLIEINQNQIELTNLEALNNMISPFQYIY